MIDFFFSKSGEESASYNGAFIHSAYDPRREAVRFISGNVLSAKKVFIVLGAGLAYISEELKKKYPESIVITFFLSDVFYRRARPRLDGPAWSPASGSSPAEFLLTHLSDELLESTAVLEWTPSIRAFPRAAASVSSQIVQTIRERQGSILTSAYFGRRWIRNSLLNFLFTERFAQAPEISRPVFIAASGPTLSDALPLLSKIREEVSVWALPSSLDALAHHALVPDYIVVTDPGYYSSFHLYPLRDFTSAQTFQSLSAVHALHGFENPIIPLAQGSFFEDDFFRFSGIPALQVPANGTVAGTALNLALKLTVREVIFAGLDFCSADIRSHVRPHGFDPLFRDTADRLSPFSSRMYERAVSSFPIRNGNGGIRSSPSLKTYTGWFSSFTRGCRRVYRLNPTAIAVDGMKSISSEELERLLSTGSKRSSMKGGSTVSGSYFSPAPHERRETVRQVLFSWHSALLQSRRDAGAAGAEELFTTRTRGMEICSCISGLKLRESRNHLLKGAQQEALKTIAAAFDEADAFLEELSQKVYS